MKRLAINLLIQLGILFPNVLLLAYSCGNKPSVPGKINTVEEENPIPDVEIRFSHPCAYVNASDMLRVRQHIAEAVPSDPVYASWLHFLEVGLVDAQWKPDPVETLVRGDATGTGVSSENYIKACRDAAAAFQLALRFQLTGEESFARAAVRILDAWASTCKKITANDNNQYLLAGFQGYTFANAAELLRDYSGWTTQSVFKDWLRQVWYAKNYWFIDNHGGDANCELHYWSNWELANMCSIMAIGIYLEDADMVNYVNRRFLAGSGSGAIGNLVPYDPVPDPDGYGMLAQNMESGRDQGHATLVAFLSAELCRMAQNVGLDFWTVEENKMLAMFEYTAKYNARPEGGFLCVDMPFSEYRYCMGCSCRDQNHGKLHVKVSADSRGKERPGWDLVYAHYVHEAGMPVSSVHYSGLFAGQLRRADGELVGDGGAGDPRYGTTSAAYDQLGWSTLLFYQGE